MLGPNGAGKTSLMNAVAGTVTPLAGEITFHGESIRKLRTEQRVARGIALVPEGRRLFSSLTVAENLRLARASRRNKRFDESMDLVQQTFPTLKERWNQSAATLSGGEQQMLAIGRALMSRPRMLLLDEPSLGLSPLLTKDIFEIIRRINAEIGTTILVVEQNAAIALKNAQDGYVMELGRIVAAGSCDELAQRQDVKEFYLGAATAAPNPEGRKQRWKRRKTWR
jgi:branched-chain amino acid transport system ATP-binding protein